MSRVERDLAHRLASLQRRLLVAKARDITRPTKGRSVLVLAPHPDDETLGCGGTVSVKRAAGTRVTVCIATDGRRSNRERVIGGDALAALRAAELFEACARLGVAARDVRRLGFEDGSLANSVPELVEEISALLGELSPEEVLVPSPIDWHGDHRALFEAAVTAAAGESMPIVLSYPVWFWSRSSWVDRDVTRAQQMLQGIVRPTLALVRLRSRTVDVSQHVEQKRHAIDAYSDELAQFGQGFVDRFITDRELFFEIDLRRAGGSGTVR